MVERKILVAVLFIAGFVVATGYTGGWFSNPDEQMTTITTSSSPSCWSTYQHDFQRTGYSNDEVPMSNDTLWVNPDVRGGFSSLIVADDRVFKYWGGYTYIIDASNGHTLWKESSSIGVQPQLTYYNGLIIQGTRSSGLEIIDVKTGNSSFIRASNVLSVGGDAPIVDDKSIVYFSENHLQKTSSDSPDSTFFAYYIENRTKRWEFSLLNEQISSSATASANGRIIIFSTQRELHALNMTDGQPMWTFSTPSGGGLSGVSSSDNLFFGIGDGNVYALKQFDGSIVWETQIASSIKRAYTPAVGGGKVFAGSDEVVYALDLKDGHILWTSDIGETIASSLTVSGGLIFAGSESGGFFALEEKDGGIIWSVRLPERKISSAAVCDGIIYIASTEGIRAIGDMKP